jgi:hypothetical protein
LSVQVKNTAEEQTGDRSSIQSRRIEKGLSRCALRKL